MRRGATNVEFHIYYTKKGCLCQEKFFLEPTLHPVSVPVTS